jgi:acyl transferase domain-containing protein
MNSSHNDIAIIGLAGRFPGAKSVDDLWQNINNKVNSIVTFSTEECIASGVNRELVLHPNYIRAKGYLEGADFFDADFFRFSHNDAEIMDPQFRILFEITWEALENAGYIPEYYPGKIGLFVGTSIVDTYFEQNLSMPGYTLSSERFPLVLHNAKDFLPSLLSYKLNLRGPSSAIQTACSTSLVSVCIAAQSILSGESDIALAGGACVTTPLKAGYLFQEGMMLSPTGSCNTFDQRANGIVLGNGAGMVVLKRLNKALEDKDTIHAVIKGFATNNDGSARIGFTAPGILGQQAVIQSALARSAVKPEQISYVETHGTGTILGDLVEIQALQKVFSSCKQRSIAIGSIKPNIGHLDAAAGIANLLKLTQALKNRILPPTVNFQQPSSQLKLEETPFYVNTESNSWKSNEPLYAGTSSFGMGGVNAHVILAEAPPINNNQALSTPVILILSARSKEALQKSCKNLAHFLQNRPQINLTDVAYTLMVGRKSFKYRATFKITNVKEAIHKLSEFKSDKILDEPFTSWLAGGDIDWDKENAENKHYRIPLPTYPFERKKYWANRDTLKLPTFKSIPKELSESKNQLEREQVVAIVKEVYEKFLIQKDINLDADFASLGGESLSAILITHEINQALQVKVPFSIMANNLSVMALVNHIISHVENQER